MPDKVIFTWRLLAESDGVDKGLRVDTDASDLVPVNQALEQLFGLLARKGADALDCQLAPGSALLERQTWRRPRIVPYGARHSLLISAKLCQAA